MGSSEIVTELRLVVTVPDYAEALSFYRDVLGLKEKASYSAVGGRVTILEAGRATLEINDSAYAAYVDEVEVGSRVAGPHPRGLRGRRSHGRHSETRRCRCRPDRGAGPHSMGRAELATRRSRRAPADALLGWFGRVT